MQGGKVLFGCPFSSPPFFFLSFFIFAIFSPAPCRTGHPSSAAFYAAETRDSQAGAASNKDIKCLLLMPAVTRR